jgi:hypothetical protein
MRLLAWIASALIIVGCGSPGASAQGIPAVFQLQSGSTVLIGLDERGRPSVEGGAASTLSSGEVDMVHQLLRDHPDAFGPNGKILRTDQPMPPITPDHIRFTFVPFESGRQSLLLIESGLGRSFLYRATIKSGGHAARTDVCQVLPGKRGVEHWPYPLDSIEIADIHFIEWKDGDALRCE